MTTETKTRELSPLNVYVRIRPFIADEIERGENENLLEIFDEKRINVKISPTIPNAIRNVQTSYNEYEVTKIFDDTCSQQKLFEEILEEPTNEIFNGSNWLFCTYGLTNSGKTHTMFGNPQDPGLIPKCLQRIFLNIGTNIDEKLSFKPDGLENLVATNRSNLDGEIAVRNYILKTDKNDPLRRIVQQEQSFEDLTVDDRQHSLWISFFELYNENILDLLVQPKEMKTRKNLRLMQNDESTIIKNLIQIPVFDLKEAENIIRFGFSNRSTSKTNLNEASSRSHAVLCLTLITLNEFDENPVMSRMYICDLAGNEPSSVGTGKQLAETCNINTSLMTFKDCIRTLNENQNSKKQMIIPYRNSVLTSIFRPFFVGRGRTVICCNVNPCATFVQQTNDLLKFCALAQKTIVVAVEPKTVATGLIRAHRKSKQKGPKRLQKNGPLKLKTHENENENETKSIRKSSSSNEVFQIEFWKRSTARALELLEKQSKNRRHFLRNQHDERVATIRYVLSQREQIETLKKEKVQIENELEDFATNLRVEQDQHLRTHQLYNELIVEEKQFRQKIVKLEKEAQENRLTNQNELDELRCQIKTFEKRFEQLNEENASLILEKTRRENDFREHDEQIREEIQRLKRDVGLELYRKQDAEKKCRAAEEKLRQYEKIQTDLTKTKNDLKILQTKYDVLQIEMIEMHKNARSKRRTNDDEEKNVKKPKRTTNEENSSTGIYETIDQNASFATVVVESSTTTPKSSTFKRIQSLFRPSPSKIIGSTRLNRVVQTKSTSIAFGSSTPTQRLPTTNSIVKKSGSPKGKYNLRTRLFTNDDDDDDKKSRIKKPQRTRK